ncbi:hypothetical protein WJX72_002517 [[Myrmecia] bisecta]|uniref:DNA ligase (NAD(+)) n=1 Tax=[Myrmecia] bisecta TaxID=41462 RepID=A0AAW1QA44_9CHLO
MVEPKIDGLAVRLTYRGGQLVEAATRGDGIEGEDVTANAAMVADIPQHVSPPTGTTTTINGSFLSDEFERALGDIGGDSRWAVAWKFPATEAITRLLGITLTLGRTGQVTAVAVLEPTVILNNRITRATLHSIRDVLDKGFCIGDQPDGLGGADALPVLQGGN